MGLVERLLASLEEGEVRRIAVGSRWTAVVAETAGGRRCGLAATLDREAAQRGSPGAAAVARWASLPRAEIAARLASADGVEASVAAATVNALLPPPEREMRDVAAEEIVAERGAGRSVALVGRFAFAARLRPRMRRLDILERRPQEDELPESEAPRVLAGAEFVAITGMAFVNGSLEGLLRMCGPQAEVLVLGPSTPLSPILFDFGVDWLAGARVTSIDEVVEAVVAGANFHRLRPVGVQRAVLARPPNPPTVP